MKVACLSVLALLTAPAAAAPPAGSAPDVEIIGAGELRPIVGASDPATELGDADEGAPPRQNPPPPTPPPNRGHGNPNPHEPPGSGSTPGEPPADKPRAEVFDPHLPLGADPQVAAGPRFVVAITAHMIGFYDKKGALLPKKKLPDGTELETKLSASDFFAMFMQPHLPGVKADNPLDVNFHIANTKDTSKNLGCDPQNPARLGGCVVEAYDSRVVYDRQRNKFWIESNLRNRVQSGCDQAKTKATCVGDGSQLKQRFQALAVSKTDDPRDGFDSVVFHIATPGDWPHIAVHHSFFLYGSNGNANLHLFDADALAKKSADVNHISLGSFTGSDFGDPEHLYLVNQHDKRDETDLNSKPTIPTNGKGPSTDVPTFLVATSGSRLTIFAFEDFHLDQPSSGLFSPKLMSASLDLDENAPWLVAPPVYRDGKIYMAGKECINGDGRTCLEGVRIVIVPVFRDGKSIGVTKDVHRGFGDFLLGGTYGQGGSFELPAIEVNKDNDVAVLYARANPDSHAGTPEKFEPGAYFSIFLHDETGHHDGVLHEADCHPDALACASTSPDNAHLDLANITIDPADDSAFWMAHGFAAEQKYHMVIGRVVARTKGFTPAHPTKKP